MARARRRLTSRTVRSVRSSGSTCLSSPDGKRVAAAFEESGKATFTYPFDEFLVVTSGTAKIKVHGGETIELKKGDVAYLREGTSVDFEFSKDFSDITCLMADHEVKWR
jgi:uncharacterized cupin superfamily protein